MSGYDPKDYKGWEDIPDVEDDGFMTVDMHTEVDRLRKELDALKRAAWDVHEVIGDWFDGNGDEDDVRKAWDAMGELLPAHRPTDRENDAHG